MLIVNINWIDFYNMCKRNLIGILFFYSESHILCKIMRNSITGTRQDSDTQVFAASSYAGAG